MAISAAQAKTYAQAGLTATKTAQDYFSNFLTVQTFGGDYMYQRLATLNTAFSRIITPLVPATPLATPQATPLPTADMFAQTAIGETAVNELIAYYNGFLTVSTFGGQYLYDLLVTIKKNLDIIQAG